MYIVVATALIENFHNLYGVKNQLLAIDDENLSVGSRCISYTERPLGRSCVSSSAIDNEYS